MWSIWILLVWSGGTVKMSGGSHAFVFVFVVLCVCTCLVLKCILNCATALGKLYFLGYICTF